MLERVMQMRGISLDIPPDDVPEDHWSYGSNVFFLDLATQRIPGYEQYYRVAGDVPVAVYPVQRKAVSYWIIILQRAADTIAIRWDGATATTLHTYVGVDALTLDWNFTDHNGTIVVNNGDSDPRYWNEATDTLDALPGWPVSVKAKVIRSFKYHLVAMGLSNVTESDYEFMWSDQSSPGAGNIPQSWTAGPSTDAGNSQLASPQGFIVDALPLRDGLMIFKDFSSHLLQYVGGNFVFSQRGLYISAGMIAQNCGVTVDDKAYVASQDDIYVTDGNSMQSICTYTVRRHIFENMNPEAIRYCQMVKKQIADEIIFAYPAGDSTYCNEAAVYNVKTERWGIRSLPDVSYLGYGLLNDPGAESSWDSRTTTWDTDETTWNERAYSKSSDEIVMAQPFAPGELDGYVFVNDRGDSANGEPINAEAMREGISLSGDPGRVTFINEVWPHIIGKAGDVINIQVGSADTEHSPTKWTPAVPFTIGSGQRKVDVGVCGRLSAFRFYSSGGAPWRLYNFRVRYREQGRY